MRRPLIVTIACMLAGCASTSSKPPESHVETATLADEAWNAEDYEYRLSAGDELGIRFPVNPDLNGQVSVGPDGRAVFPLVASVKLAGLTVAQANARLSQVYSKVLRNPVVNVVIYAYGGGQVYVAGEVRQPGARNIRGEYSVMRAVMESGGFEITARTNKVVLLRRRPTDGKVLMRAINVNSALKGEPGQDMRVLPGDVVFVPRSKISEVNRIVQQYITQSLPFTMNYQINDGNNINNIN
jgi:protein involved in polysaccharide export with SLBB domain